MRIKNRAFSNSLRHILLLSALLPSTAFAEEVAETMAGDDAAEDDAAETDNIIYVVAERRRERLQEIPIAITSLSGEALNDSGISSTQDLTLVTPGLTFTAATGNSAPFLRGVGNNNVGPGAESGVATYVDGVYYASVSATVFSLTSVSQVDVLKGPQGTLFGRNATGGVVQVTTKNPDFLLSGNTSLTYGNADTVAFDAYVNGPISENLAANIAFGYHNQQDGFGVNLTTGNDINKTKTLSVRSKLLWEPGDDTQVVLSGDYFELDSSQGVAWRPPYGSVPMFVPPFTGGEQDIYSEIDPYYVSYQGGVALTIEHDFGFAELRSISAYRRETQDLVADRDMGLPISTVTAFTHKITNQYSQEFQLVGPSDSRLKWVVGLYGFKLDSAFDPLTIMGPGLTPLDSLEYFSGQKAYSGAIFGQATLDDILPSTDFTLGARYTVERREVLIDSVGFAGPASMPLGGTEAKRTFKSPTWRLSLDHEFSRMANAYISYNRGFKSGTFNLLDIPATSVEPEELDAFEAGLKLDLFDRRLKVNTAAFYYKYRNMQVPRYSGGVVTITNAGAARMYGLDMDASFDITSSLHLRAGMALLNAKYEEFDDAIFSTPAPGGGNVITEQSAAGNYVLLAPKATFNAAVDYTFPGPLDGLKLNVTYFYNDGWFANPNNRLRQPSFNQINSRLTWTLPDERFSITVWGRNLTDEVFAQYLSETEAISDVYSASMPRTYGLTLAASF